MRRKKRKSQGGEPLSDADEQLELLAVPAHPVEAEADQVKRCTGQLLFERYPDDYAQIVGALAASMPIRRIKRLWGVGTGTVYAILRREGAKVGTLKAQIANNLFLGVKAGSEHFAELIQECDDVVAVSMAIKAMAETAQLMAGQATQITEHRVISVNANEAAEQLRALVSQMDSESGEKFPLPRDVTPGAQAAAGAPAALPVEGAEIMPMDSTSSAAGARSLDLQGAALPCHTPRHTGQPRRAVFEGGGGDGARRAADAHQ